ncbi:MAG: chemotaxis protein CheW [Verrucomicrobia bacterium]|nr:MAG: chemotaxis protein CheW [Verrucomicrobiota bacterium]TAE87778.1 MAG: chemotaxis protein CheW [Verrucomicrobiota bacterium]TAF25521.1 MAG: chemotaxis protein CheW [Verrucomicrobiota bacterium]TAF41412.1 MAG: chemotaxis protein CheW [Verrucomicrobiota bacterium]
MRRPRLKAPAFLPVAYYHCVSRVVNREFVFGEEEKDKLVGYMRLYERFGGLRVISYCIMSNHFHILVEVPQRPDAAALPDDAGLVAKVRSCLGDKLANDLERQLDLHRKQNNDSAAEELRDRWFARMWDVSAFMKVLKQRFSQWFNGRHARRGTLWEDRFRSVLVEGKGQALRAMAAYIDLNPVRAKICDDPKDYRWCGYAEAVAGGKEAREVVEFLSSLNPHGGVRPDEGAILSKEALRRWRCHLFGIPENEARQTEEALKGEMAAIHRERIPREKALEVLARGGKLSQADYLRCKVRYFSDGAVIGGKAFVNEMFAAVRDRFGPKRKDGARPIRGLDGDPGDERLFNFRQLRKGVFG